jgi:HAD superfamily hydrolase (TIGR01509 family)
MTNSEPLDPVEIVVFDLGGVLVQICATWEQAAVCAGVATSLPTGSATPFTALTAFDDYQAAKIDETEYLAALADRIGCSPVEARRVHNHILVEPFPGTDELVSELHRLPIATGCLSNTNALHWEELIDGERFPAIAALQQKMASHLVGMNKPDPAIFRHYAEVYGVDPRRVAYFDDNGPNVEVARQVGFRTMLIDPKANPVAQIRRFLTEQRVLDS